MQLCIICRPLNKLGTEYNWDKDKDIKEFQFRTIHEKYTVIGGRDQLSLLSLVSKTLCAVVIGWYQLSLLSLVSKTLCAVHC